MPYQSTKTCMWEGSLSRLLCPRHSWRHGSATPWNRLPCPCRPPPCPCCELWARSPCRRRWITPAIPILRRQGGPTLGLGRTFHVVPQRRLEPPARGAADHRRLFGVHGGHPQPQHHHPPARRHRPGAPARRFRVDPSTRSSAPHSAASPTDGSAVRRSAALTTADSSQCRSCS